MKSFITSQIQREFQLGDTGWRIYKTRDKKDWIRTSRAKTLDSYKIRLVLDLF